MYIESVINDYCERSDFDASAFQFLSAMAEDYRNQELMIELNQDLNDSDNIQLNETNDLPF